MKKNDGEKKGERRRSNRKTGEKKIKKIKKGKEGRKMQESSNVGGSFRLPR